MKKSIAFDSQSEHLAGELHNDTGENPIVIILTGDSKKGLDNGTWYPLIEQLTQHHFCVFAFDFHSQGKSTGERSTLSLSKGIANFQDALSFIKTFTNGNKRHYIIIASSFGAAVLLNSHVKPSPMTALVFKSPAVLLFKAYENEVGGLPGLEKWRDEDISSVNGLSYEAYLQSVEVTSMSGLDTIECPVLIVQGDEDEIVSLESSERLKLLLGRRCELRLLPGVKHNYKQSGAQSAFNQLTLEFLDNLL